MEIIRNFYQKKSIYNCRCCLYCNYILYDSSITEIAKESNCSRKTIYNRLEQYGISKISRRQFKEKINSKLESNNKIFGW